MGGSGSVLLLDEYFSSGDDRFLHELLTCRSEKKFATFASSFYEDARPWARGQMLRYIDDGCDRDNHRLLVKRLFKLAEAAGDDEVMAHFLVAFDRLNRRTLVTKYGWDRVNRVQTATLELQPDKSIVGRLNRKPRPNARPRQGVSPARFSRVTRLYLSRRCCRYFRSVGFKDHARFRAMSVRAMRLYSNDHLTTPEMLLDSWGLLHLLYRSSPEITRAPSGAKLTAGKRLQDIAPSPMHAAAWNDREAFEDLFRLVGEARSRTVQRWARLVIERDFSTELRGVPVDRLLILLRSGSEEAEALALAALRGSSELDKVGASTWLELLALRNLDTVQQICALIEKHVHPGRLTLAQCVELATAPVAAVADLGLKWTREKTTDRRADLDLLLRLSEARTPTVRAAAAKFVVARLEASKHVLPTDARFLADARFREVRQEGLRLAHAMFPSSVVLWGQLSESPHDDVRIDVIRTLESLRDSLDDSSHRRLWATSLLAIQRGGRAKRLVAKQIAERVAEAPHLADELLPLLRVALRSVRPPERRAGLAALAQAARANASLREAMTRLIPEMSIGEVVAA